MNVLQESPPRPQRRHVIRRAQLKPARRDCAVAEDAFASSRTKDGAFERDERSRDFRGRQNTLGSAMRDGEENQIASLLRVNHNEQGSIQFHLKVGCGVRGELYYGSRAFRKRGATEGLSVASDENVGTRGKGSKIWGNGHKGRGLRKVL